MQTIRSSCTGRISIASFLSRTLLCGGFLVALSAHAGVEGLGDEDNAKLARDKARTKQISSKKTDTKSAGSVSGVSGDTSKCGSLEVGNVSNSKPGRPVKEVTVIVDGPVINANNKCR
jgi:hypothetical protein